jgi:drug/metabolite transporter (DMT)-like permease
MTTTRESAARLRPYLLLVAMAAISTAAPLFRKAATTTPLVAAGWRLAIAAAVLLPWTLRAAFRRPPARFYRAAALAGVCYTVHFGAWVTSLALTSIAASVTLVTTTPLLLGLAGAITGRDRPDRRFWLYLGLAFLGLLALGRQDVRARGDALAGDVLALVGAAAMASYLAIARRVGDDMDLGAFSGVATATGAALLFGAARALGMPLTPSPPAALGYLALAALLPQLVGHNLLTWAVRDAKPAAVAMTVVGEPVGATLIAYLWLGETVAPAAAVGCALTLSAVVLAAVDSRRQTTARRG